MFNSSRRTNPDRRGRRSSARETAVSSRVSLFPGMTASSGGSSGSGFTITPESVSRSRRAAKASTTLGHNKEQAAPPPIARGQSTGSSATQKSSKAINVFAFLENDPSRPLTADLDVGAQDTIRHIHDTPMLQEEFDLDSSARSLHSDSGISIRDSSPESLHRRPYPRSALDPLPEADPTHSLRLLPLKSHQHHSKMRPGRDRDAKVDAKSPSPDELYYDGAPETFYRDHAHPGRLIAARSVQSVADGPMADPSGYDLLAARLTDTSDVERPLRPLYRKFTRLNHRILLQLQDEISQMEEDLAGLDAADARFRRDSTGQIAPESRRSNWQWHGSELHARRLDLLGQIYVKVEQYNQALTSFQNVMKGTIPCSQSDVQHYRSWIKENGPIAEVEQRFLDEPDDLLAFCAHKSCPTCAGHASLGPGFINVVIMGFVMVTALFTVFLFVLSPRMGTLLMISVGVTLYTNRNEVTGAVTDYLNP